MLPAVQHHEQEMGVLESLLRHAARNNTITDVLEAIVYSKKFFRANLIFGLILAVSLYSLTRASQR